MINIFILGMLLFIFEASAQEKNCDDFANKYIRSIESLLSLKKENPLVQFQDLDHLGPNVNKTTDTKGGSVFSFKIPDELSRARGRYKITVGKRDKWGNSQIIVHHEENYESLVFTTDTIITFDSDCNVFRHSEVRNMTLRGFEPLHMSHTVNPTGCFEVRSLVESLEKKPHLTSVQISQRLKKIEKDTGTTVTKKGKFSPQELVENLDTACNTARSLTGMKIEAKKKSEGLSEPQSTGAETTIKGQ